MTCSPQTKEEDGLGGVGESKPEVVAKEDGEEGKKGKEEGKGHEEKEEEQEEEGEEGETKPLELDTIDEVPLCGWATMMDVARTCPV